MNNLKYVVQVGYYEFTFDNADEAVAFAITAKLKGSDKSNDVLIDFVELEEENVIGESDNEEAAQSSETEK